MITVFVTLFCLAGYAISANRFLNLKAAYTPFATLSFVMVALYLFALSGYLDFGAIALLVSGGVLTAFFMPGIYARRNEILERYKIFLYALLVLVLASVVVSIGMAFTVIDDYVYWGIIGKYLFLHDHLPVPGNPLDSKILAYTPGMGLFHYLFFLPARSYGVSLSYFAQNMVLISSLLVVFDSRKTVKSLTYIAVLILLLTIFCGSVFTKLQVDPMLSVFLFAIFWIWTREKNPLTKIIAVFMPVSCLFLIKEIGFVLSLMVLGMMICDLLSDPDISRAKKMGFTLIIFVNLCMVFGLKLSWGIHIVQMEFNQFHSAISLESAKEAFNFGLPQNRGAAWKYLKEVFIGSADRLNIPYFVWYLVTLWMGIVIAAKEKRDDLRRMRFFFMVAFFMLIYLAMLYCLQVIIFGLQKGSEEVIGFSRYFNILFAPLVFIVIISFLHRALPEQRLLNKKVPIILVALALIAVFASRIEVALHREKQDVEIQQLSEQYVSHLSEGNFAVGVIREKRDNLAQLQFLYYFLPNKVDYNSARFENPDDLQEYIIKHDFLILFDPAPETLDWLKAFVMPGKEIPLRGLVRVLKKRVPDDRSANSDFVEFKLEPIAQIQGN